MYWIVPGVTSDVGMPSTYLFFFMLTVMVFEREDHCLKFVDFLHASWWEASGVRRQWPDYTS